MVQFEMKPSSYEMWSADDAAALILRTVPTLEAETLRWTKAQGRILAEDARAPGDLPALPTSTVDGYAVRAEDGAADRTWLAELTAGRVYDGDIGPGQALRIMTGAPVPRGADAVVMVEDTELDGERVRILRPPRPGQNVTPVGADMAAGEVVLRAGDRLGAPEVGLLAMIGRTSVRVTRRPRVAILSTGDELVEPDEPLRPGVIRDSNRYALAAAVREAGGEPLLLGVARDDPAEQRRLIVTGLESADVLLTSGGVSVGSRDLIKPILSELGTIHFGRIAFKPGKPLTFATVGRSVAFGLPGFPVSSLVTFEVFVRPALLAMQRARQVQRPRVQARLAHRVGRAIDRTEYQRAVLRWSGGGLMVATTGLQTSSRLLSLVGSNSLVKIPPGEDDYQEGDLVETLVIGQIEE
ncbi:MAG TPA: gephyrin-like molybdotransferase Glp [Dehalococcoidia bacterium]|nr:gephyrin-like molybdotransferase Glp [Dehalococcoidia bacterium]